MNRKKPGERGYLAYWRQEINEMGLPRLRGQTVKGQPVSGRAIHATLKAYGGDFMNNATGEAWQAQPIVAKAAGISVRVLSRVQAWVEAHGLLFRVAEPIPGVRGIHYRATLPDGHETLVDRLMATEVPVSEQPRSLPESAEVPASTDECSLPVEAEVPASTTEVPASSGRQTLISNSQKNSQQELSSSPDSGVSAPSGADELLRVPAGRSVRREGRPPVDPQERERIDKAYDDAYGRAYAELSAERDLTPEERAEYDAIRERQSLRAQLEEVPSFD